MQLIGGMQNLAVQGQIASDGTLTPYYITTEQANAYNAAIANFKTETYDQSTAEAFINSKVVESNNAMNAALSTFTGAATQFITVTALNYELQAANDANDGIAVQAINDTVTAGGAAYTIETAEVTAYNNSLDGFTSAAQDFAAFTAVSNDANTLAAIQADLDAASVSGNDISVAYFDDASKALVMQNSDVSATYTTSYDLSAFMAILSDLELEGSSSDFYTSGPTQNTACFVNGTGCGGSGPPPNTTLYGDPDGDGITQPTAYTDNDGVIVNFVAGDDVYLAEDGSYLGYYDGAGAFVCDSGSAMCSI